MDGRCKRSKKIKQSAYIGSNLILFLLIADLDFNGDEPPIWCGQTDNGNDKICCKKVGERKRTIPEKKYG